MSPFIPRRFDERPPRRKDSHSRFLLVRNSSRNLTDSRHLNEVFFDTS